MCAPALVAWDIRTIVARSFTAATPSACSPTCSRAQAMVASCARAFASADPGASDLVQLVDRHQRLIVRVSRNAEVLEHPSQQPAMVEPEDEVLESERQQDIRHGGAQLRLHDERLRSDGVDVALVEPPKAS